MEEFGVPEWKKQKLESIEFIENYKKHLISEEDIWQRNFLATVNFFLTYQRLPTRRTDYFLENWVSTQRQLLKKKKLSEERNELFKEAGIDLLKRSFIKIVAPWEQRYGEVKAFLMKNGKLPDRSNNSKLYWWLYHQRKKFGEGKLDKRQIQKLKSIGLDLTSSDTKGTS